MANPLGRLIVGIAAGLIVGYGLLWLFTALGIF